MSKVDQTDLVFGVRSGFINRSASKITSLRVQLLRFVTPG